MAENPSEKTDESVICKKNLNVDVHDSRRVTFDLTEQEANPTPKTWMRDEMAENLSEENKGNVICQKSLTVDANHFFSLKVRNTNVFLNEHF